MPKHYRPDVRSSSTTTLPSVSSRTLNNRAKGKKKEGHAGMYVTRSQAACMVGCVPPPHLSPFVDVEAEGYVPEYAEASKRLEAAERKESLPLPGTGKEDLGDPQSLLGINDRAEAIEAAERQRKMTMQEKKYHNELKLELQGVRYSAISDEVRGKDAEVDALSGLNQIAEDASNMSKIVMSRKRRELWEVMVMHKRRKMVAAQRLEKYIKHELQGVQYSAISDDVEAKDAEADARELWEIMVMRERRKIDFALRLESIIYHEAEESE